MRALLQAIRQVVTGDVRAARERLGPRVALALIVISTTTANIIGAGIVGILLFLVLPQPDGALDDSATALAISINGAYVLLAVLIGTFRGLRVARPVRDFFASDRPPTEEDRRNVLRLPLRLLAQQAVLWTVGAVLFGTFGFIQDALFGVEVLLTIGLGGVATSTLAYLFTQRLLRAGVALVLAEAPPRRREVPGVGARALVAWALGAVPVAGTLILGLFGLVLDTEVDDLALATLVLSAVAIWVGGMAIVVFARSVSDPLRRLRDAFAKVEEGDFDVNVPVYDATEVGYAAAAFNRMASGLQERERLRDLFGRQVGTDVARRALEEGVTLGGEEREAAVLFCDIIGSTSYAAGHRPTEVVDVLNRFFTIVVEVCTEHGGLVNKFIGDEALCVFGAPLAQDDPAGAALAAARRMCSRLRDELPELKTGIGVSAGTVVAGNVGTSDRYEYTVIGDPVNEAARLTELAKEHERGVIASDAAVRAAGGDEADNWEQEGETTLRGREEPTRLAVPA